MLGAAAYKPDGRKIMFAGSSGRLYIKRATGRGRARPVTRAFDPRGRIGDDDMGEWSPDGQNVVFVRFYDTGDPDQSAPRPRTGPCAGQESCLRIYHRGRSRALSADAVDPAWSTRGLIAFSDADHRLWVIRPDGSGRRRLGVRGENPDWSPDGRRLVYEDARGQNPSGRLRIVSADGRRSRRLGRSGSYPRFSPNGRSIVYTTATGRRSTFRAYITDLRGRRRHRLRTRYPEPHAQDWQPLPRRRRR